MGGEQLYSCVFVYFFFLTIILFSSPVCSAEISRVHGVKCREGGGAAAAEGRAALAVYVKAQHCLMLHKAFVHSFSKPCVYVFSG